MGAPAYPAAAVLKKGAKAIDLARGLTIEVLEPQNSRPLVYEVRVQWDKDLIMPATNMPTGGTPGGFNLRIQQGDKSGDATWESPDIWVERAPYNDDKHMWDYGWR